MAGEEISRPMKYPYTFTAKIAQFPWRFHIENNWMYKYMIFGVILSLPVFYKIQRLANSPGNVRQWEEKKRLEREARHH